MDLIINKDINSLSLLVTLKCNLSCDYCYVDQRNIVMDFKTGKKAVDFFLDSAGDTKRITFLGGEPLLNLSLLEKLLDYIHFKKKFTQKKIITILNTNGTILNDRIINLFKRINLLVISFDGVKVSNDAGRVFSSGGGTFDIIYKNLNFLLDKFSDKIILSKVISSNNIYYLYEDFIFLLNLKPFKISISLALGDHGWDNHKLYILDSSLKNLLIYLDRFPSKRNILKPLLNDFTPVCILSHLCCSPCGDFYPCEFLYFLGGEKIGSFKGVNNKFLNCTFSEKNDLCNGHKCLNCSDLCKQKDFKRLLIEDTKGYKRLIDAEVILIKFKNKFFNN